MGNQGDQTKGNQGNRDREGNLGQTGNDMSNPAGTSGRDTERNEKWQQGNESNKPAGSQPDVDSNEDEDSGIGNRSTNR